MRGAIIKGQVVIYPINPLCYYEIAHDAPALSWRSCPWQREDRGRSVQGLRPTDHTFSHAMENNVHPTVRGVPEITLAWWFGHAWSEWSPGGFTYRCWVNKAPEIIIWVDWFELMLPWGNNSSCYAVELVLGNRLSWFQFDWIDSKLFKNLFEPILTESFELMLRWNQVRVNFYFEFIWSSREWTIWADNELSERYQLKTSVIESFESILGWISLSKWFELSWVSEYFELSRISSSDRLLICWYGLR